VEKWKNGEKIGGVLDSWKLEVCNGKTWNSLEKNNEGYSIRISCKEYYCKPT
jgi:hypothetical protein